MEHLSAFAASFWLNFTHNLFKPLLLFFYAGFFMPILRVKFEFPPVMYQGLTIYLLLAIGWHGGEELALLSPNQLGQVWGFMVLGFITNALIGLIAYKVLRMLTPLRRVDAATVGAFYGSDSAGTFVTAVGVLTTARIVFAPYMPVMLAIMEIPGCLVGLFLVSKLRNKGMDAKGNMPGETNYMYALQEDLEQKVTTANPSEEIEIVCNSPRTQKLSAFKLDPQLLHEVFLNPGLYLLFAGIVIGFISRRQGADVVKADDALLVTLFQGALCLFLLEMGITASKKLRDLKSSGWKFIAFALLSPTLFAITGLLLLTAYSHLTHTLFELGTYVLFACLCGSASYIAVPAVQRLAIPEASATLPLAASLGITFTYNVTIGISLYIEIARKVIEAFPLP